MAAITIRQTFTIVAPVLLFLLLTFDVQFGLVFITFLFSDVLFFLLDTNITFRIERPGNNKLTTALWAIGGFFGFTLIAPFFVTLFVPFFGFVDQASLGVGSVIELYSQYIPFFAEIEPVLSDQPLLIFIGFGLMVTIVETIFFNGVLYESITDLLKINTSNFNLRNIAVAFGVIPGIATAFHFSVRGIDVAATSGLLLTFLFFAIGQFIVIQRRQILDAIGMHTIANSTAIAISLGFAALEPAIIPVIFVVIFFFIIRSTSIRRIFQRN